MGEGAVRFNPPGQEYNACNLARLTPGLPRRSIIQLIVLAKSKLAVIQNLNDRTCSPILKYLEIVVLEN